MHVTRQVAPLAWRILSDDTALPGPSGSRAEGAGAGQSAESVEAVESARPSVRPSLATLVPLAAAVVFLIVAAIVH